MNNYSVPEVAFITFGNDSIIATSADCLDKTCDDYNCPQSYGNTCTGLPVD